MASCACVGRPTRRGKAALRGDWLVVPGFEVGLRCYAAHIGIDGMAYSAFLGDWVEFELKAERALCLVSDQPPCAPRIALAMCSGRTPTPTICAAIRCNTGRREIRRGRNGGARGVDPSRASKRVITRF